MSEVGRPEGIALAKPCRPRYMPLRGASLGRVEGRKLEEVCAAVEGMFLAQLLSELGRPAFRGGVLGSSLTSRLFSAQRDWALGAELGRRGDLGLAKMVYSELNTAIADARTSKGEPRENSGAGSW